MISISIVCRSESRNFPTSYSNCFIFIFYPFIPFAPCLSLFSFLFNLCLSLTDTFYHILLYSSLLYTTFYFLPPFTIFISYPITSFSCLLLVNYLYLFTALCLFVICNGNLIYLSINIHNRFANQEIQKPKNKLSRQYPTHNTTLLMPVI